MTHGEVIVPHSVCVFEFSDLVGVKTTLKGTGFGAHNASFRTLGIEFVSTHFLIFFLSSFKL